MTETAGCRSSSRTTSTGANSGAVLATRLHAAIAQTPNSVTPSQSAAVGAEALRRADARTLCVRIVDLCVIIAWEGRRERARLRFYCNSGKFHPSIRTIPAYALH